MTRSVSHETSYQLVEKYNQYADALLYFSTVLSISISLMGYYNKEPTIKDILIGINILSVCLYVFLDNRANYIFTKVEMKRRLDWLDNSFGTNFSGKKSTGYFTNEHLSPGIYKLAVNCFENSYHTQFIISKMLRTILVQTVVIVTLFICSSYLGNREVIRIFFELSLPVVLIQKLIKAVYYSSRIAEVHDKLKLLFNDLMQAGIENKTAEALRDIIEYETTLSWASTPLSNKVFKKYQNELATDWEEYKKNYRIA